MIKNYFLPIFALIFVVASCSKSQPGPGETMIEMYKRICENKNIDIMLEYTAPESLALVGLGIGMIKSLEDSFPSKDKDGSSIFSEDEMCPENIKVISEKIDGNKAIVVLSNEEDKPIELVKINEKWLMVVKK